jgi:DNA ligase-1
MARLCAPSMPYVCWIKVNPVHTLDLVILAVEWGHGLGLADAMLAWQTHRDGWTVSVRPEPVVEIAFDRVERSPRYPGGVRTGGALSRRQATRRCRHDSDSASARASYEPRDRPLFLTVWNGSQPLVF